LGYPWSILRGYHKMVSIYSILCEELNNSPQIEAAADGRPFTRYAANSRSNGAARRVWRLGWRTREFGVQGWRARKFGDQGWRSREFGDPGWRAREFGDLAGKARVPCAKTGNGTPLDLPGIYTIQN